MIFFSTEWLFGLIKKKKKNQILKTYRLVAAGRRLSGSPHSESHTKTPHSPLVRDKDKNIPELRRERHKESVEKGFRTALKDQKDQSPQSRCIAFQIQDVILW